MARPIDSPDPTGSLGGTEAAFSAWLDAHRDTLAAFRDEQAEGLAESVARYRPLQEMLWDGGWTRLGWAPEYGGLGGTPLHRFVVADVLADAGYVVPEIIATIEIIAPMLVRYAPHLAATHLGAAVRGDEVWCQGFSEPDAGSDLGSLRTRAEPDGTGFRIAGQKMWSSFGSIAQWCCLLARTGEPADGYRGLTMFWVDLASPGVTVVPTACANGRDETAEIFLDGVFVPADALIGAPGQGWAAVMYLMQYERGAFAWIRQTEHLRALRELAGHATSPGGETILGDAFLAVFGLRSLARDTTRRLAAGEELGPEISVDKLLLGSAEQTVAEAARRLLSPRLELTDDPTSAWWRQRWAYSRITTIYGGAAEVQRDLVAERLLGLPRGR